jgi:hypothetical protein
VLCALCILLSTFLAALCHDLRVIQQGAGLADTGVGVAAASDDWDVVFACSI